MRKILAGAAAMLTFIVVACFVAFLSASFIRSEHASMLGNSANAVAVFAGFVAGRTVYCKFA
ncbi:MAG: hypothetical protein CMJ64_14805 [Planctomycetaceae bacterium]|jgi:hypothetical protein|nr:hypothetical protein [Planctomycetaceae bacterium]